MFSNDNFKVFDLSDVVDIAKKDCVMAYGLKHNQSVIVRTGKDLYSVFKYFEKDHKVELEPQVIKQPFFNALDKLKASILGNIERYQNIYEDGFYEEEYDERNNYYYRKVDIFDETTTAVIIIEDEVIN